MSKINTCTYCGASMLPIGRSGRCQTPGCPNEAYPHEMAEYYDECDLAAEAIIENNLAEEAYESHLTLMPIHVIGRVTTWASH